MGSQSKCSQVESVVSSSIVMKEGKRAGVRVGCVCVYVYMYIYVYMYMYIYMHNGLIHGMFHQIAFAIVGFEM